VGVGFPDENIFLLHHGARNNKYLPFKANIEKQLDLVAGFAEPDDVLLVAFSGHGVHLGDQRYLCPTAADLDRRQTLVPLGDVYQTIRGSRANLRLLIVDACRDDPRPPGVRSAGTEPDLTKLGEGFERPPEGIVLLSSCATGETSMESDDFRQGVFTHYLLEGLAGQADNNSDARITISEVSQYVGQKTKTYVARNYNTSQRPRLQGDLSTEVLAYSLTRGVRATDGMPRIPFRSPPSSGEEFTNSIGMKLRRIPAGEFMMGSGKSAGEIVRLFDLDKDDAKYYTDEHPQHRVRITKPFHLGVHEVTVGQFRTFVDATEYKTEPEKDGEGGWGYDEKTGKFEGRKPQYTWRNVGWQQTDDHPVVNVTWNDAVEFCKWLSKKDGQPYRLPTEAEWEYACRAGTATMYTHGDDPEGLADVGNVADGTAKAKFSNWTTISARDGYVFTAPVGQFRPNGFGLYDMHGNVYEWCQDWHGEDYYGNSPPTNPEGPSSGSGSSRVLRGGSWCISPRLVRSAGRFWGTPAFRSRSSGFRVLCELE